MRVCIRRVEDKMSGLIEVARWWRQRQRQDSRLASRLLPPEIRAAQPRTQLLHVACSVEGRQFLVRRVQELKNSLEQFNPKRSKGAAEAAEISATIGSMLHLLGQLLEAESYLQRAAELDSEGKFKCQLERVRRERSAKKLLHDAMHLPEKQGTWDIIDRVDAATLTKDLFFHRYASAGVPVIITGLLPKMFPKGVWTRERLKEELGSKTIVPRHRVPQSPDWASLEDAPATTIAAFLDAMETGKQSVAEDKHTTPESTYLFDWNLPDNAAELCSELSIPIYFEDDLLQLLPEGAMYHNAWPSLFVGPRGTRSGLHVDAFGSNFWMAVLEGKKHWMLFRREDAALLGPSYRVSLDPSFAAEKDGDGFGLGDTAGERGEGLDHLKSAAGGWDFILEAGEVLFVPAGCPHGVRNETDTIAISANYVDTSNLSLVIGELELLSTEDPRAKVVLDSLKEKQHEILSSKDKLRELRVAAMNAGLQGNGGGGNGGNANTRPDAGGGDDDDQGDLCVSWSQFKKRRLG